MVKLYTKIKQEMKINQIDHLKNPQKYHLQIIPFK